MEDFSHRENIGPAIESPSKVEAASKALVDALRGSPEALRAYLQSDSIQVIHDAEQVAHIADDSENPEALRRAQEQLEMLRQQVIAANTEAGEQLGIKPPEFVESEEASSEAVPTVQEQEAEPVEPVLEPEPIVETPPVVMEAAVPEKPAEPELAVTPENREEEKSLMTGYLARLDTLLATVRATEGKLAKTVKRDLEKLILDVDRHRTELLETIPSVPLMKFRGALDDFKRILGTRFAKWGEPAHETFDNTVQELQAELRAAEKKPIVPVAPKTEGESGVVEPVVSSGESEPTGSVSSEPEASTDSGSEQIEGMESPMTEYFRQADEFVRRSHDIDLLEGDPRREAIRALLKDLDSTINEIVAHRVELLKHAETAQLMRLVTIFTDLKMFVGQPTSKWGEEYGHMVEQLRAELVHPVKQEESTEPKPAEGVVEPKTEGEPKVSAEVARQKYIEDLAKKEAPISATEEKKLLEGPTGAMAAAISAAEVGVHFDEDGGLEEIQKAVREYGEKADIAVEQGSEKELREATDETEKIFLKNQHSRLEEVELLDAIPQSERTEIQEARLMELDCATAIEKKTIERRRVQEEIVKLKRIQKITEMEVTAVQEKLKMYETDSLLAASSESTQENALPGLGSKKKLEEDLSQLLENKKTIDGQIEMKEGQANDLVTKILQLQIVMDRKSEEIDRLQAEEEADRVAEVEAEEDAAAQVKMMDAKENLAATTSSGNGSGSGSMERGSGGASSSNTGAKIEKFVNVMSTYLTDPGEMAVAFVDYIFKPKTQEKAH